MRRLLTHLAQFSSFSKQGEVLCTQSLKYLLENPEARNAFAAHISKRASTAVSGDLDWKAEVRQEDRGRPDLEGYAADGKPSVKVEAKLSAAFDEAQFGSYVRDLENRCGTGLLLVLVPRYRAEDAKQAVARAFGVAGEPPWYPGTGSGCSIALTFWEDVLEALRIVGSDSFKADLQQFEAMYRVLNGYDIEPIADESQLADWRERETVFVNLVDRTTRRLWEENKLPPMGKELEPVKYHRRYVCRSLGTEQPCYSVGVRDSFAGYNTPIWLRFHQSTAAFQVIRSRLVGSSLSTRLVESSGHIWISLDVPLDTDGEGVIDSLIAQVNEIVAIAYRPLTS